MIKSTSQVVTEAWGNFLRLESAGGIVLVIAAFVAVLLANSPLAGYYGNFLNANITVTVADVGVSKPFLLWINDGLMAIFFLLIGLELKREVVEGQLSSADQIVLPSLAALGGLAVPAVIYWLGMRMYARRTPLRDRESGQLKQPNI